MLLLITFYILTVYYFIFPQNPLQLILKLGTLYILLTSVFPHSHLISISSFIPFSIVNLLLHLLHLYVYVKLFTSYLLFYLTFKIFYPYNINITTFYLLYLTTKVPPNHLNMVLNKIGHCT